jgi:hypothetical protein
MRSVLFVVVLLLTMLVATTGSAFDPVSVRNAEYKLAKVSAKNANVTWSWKVVLSNDTDTGQEVKLKVQLLDFSDFEIDHVQKKVHLDMWETKTVSGQHKLPKDLWDKVVKANYVLE